MNLRKLLLMLVVAVVGGAVFAIAVPDGSTLTLTDASGNLVGAGSYMGGNLTLDVLGTFSGDATLTITNRGGHAMTYDVSVDSSGNVTLVSSGEQLQKANPSILARGGTVTIDQVATVTPPSTLAKGPDAHANANASEGAGNATEGIGNAAAAASVGVDHANSHASNGSGNAQH